MTLPVALLRNRKYTCVASREHSTVLGKRSGLYGLEVTLISLVTQHFGSPLIDTAITFYLSAHGVKKNAMTGFLSPHAWLMPKSPRFERNTLLGGIRKEHTKKSEDERVGPSKLPR